jgi:ubiquinone/menaquinone biosynthesis C-methylase UbiE
MPKRQETFTIDEWAKFLKHQANHTKKERHTLYEKVELKTKKNILDIGCGTGAIVADIASLTTGRITGIDTDKERLSYTRATTHIPGLTLVGADAQDLPFKDETFDLVVFSVVLMYVKDKQKAVTEMARVTQKNGIVLATMEPDHAGTLLYPEDEWHPFFIKDLKEMDADLRVGRKLKYLFTRAGLKTEVGMSNYGSDIRIKDTEKQLEDFLNRFWVTERLFQKNGWTDSQIKEYKQNKIELIKNGLYFFFLPVFYAIGKKE